MTKIKIFDWCIRIVKIITIEFRVNTFQEGSNKLTNFKARSSVIYSMSKPKLKDEIVLA